MRYMVEMTDTFGGEANYSWVRRADFRMSADATDRQIVRRAKRELGITMRHKKEVYEDTIRLDFSGACICVFISPDFDTMTTGDMWR